jgi:hypothetical protein
MEDNKRRDEEVDKKERGEKCALINCAVVDLLSFLGKQPTGAEHDREDEDD